MLAIWFVLIIILTRLICPFCMKIGCCGVGYPTRDFHQRITSRWSVILYLTFIKAFQQSRYSGLFAFLILASLQERALDAARIKKASHFRERLCIEVPSGFEPL